MNKVSKPGIYNGYSEAVYDGWKRFSEYVTMRDGVRIAVDYYRPTKNGVAEEKPLPVVWIFTPYDYRTVFATGRFSDGREYTPYSEEDTLGQAKLLAAHGYVFAAAEVRGTGASFGFRQSVNSEIEAWDGYEICKWLASQSWSNGNVGTFGYSYYGATQLEMMRKNPPGLKGAFIGMTDIDKYDGWVRGGSLRAFGTQPDAAYMLAMNNIPVSDEKNDEKGKDLLEKAVMQHRFSTKQGENMRACPYRDSWCEETDTNLWQNISNTSYLKEINNSDTLVYLYGGWRDVFRRDTIMMYRNMTNAKKMLFGPWHHMDYRPGFDMAAEKLRFFDYCLKGIENGIMDEPPIYYSTGGTKEENEWNFAYTWPLPGTENISMFFSEGKSGSAPSFNDGMLTLYPPETENMKDDYKVIYDIKENLDNDLETTDRDEKGVTYTTAPLEEDMKVAGYPLMDMWISSTADDGDFFVFLEDIDEKGNGTYITDGKLRASFRTVTAPYYDFGGLPWHRCNKEDEHKLIPGKPYRLEIDLMPMSHLFRKGHRIRITVTCACNKIFFLQEENAPIVSIYRDLVHTSYIRLPLVK